MVNFDGRIVYQDVCSGAVGTGEYRRSNEGAVACLGVLRTRMQYVLFPMVARRPIILLQLVGSKVEDV